MAGLFNAGTALGNYFSEDANLKIAVIQASSQAGKNAFIYETVARYAGSDVVNFGCREGGEPGFSYVEISLLIGMLLYSGAVDFVVTGCSSGQGMALACNSLPGTICGYAPTPMDAYLFCQINNGNALSLPLGEDYTWSGFDNCEATIKAAFSEPFGQGYPKSEAARKLKDTELLKSVRKLSQTGFIEFLEKLDEPLIEKALSKRDVVGYITERGGELAEWIKKRIRT